MIGYWLLLSILALVTTFGVGTALNMLFRRWWLALVLYALFSAYLLWTVGGRMIAPEWVLYAVGWLGVLLAAVGIRALKNRGYPLFRDEA